MNLTKRQVGALLEVLSKDEARPILQHAKIDMYKGKPVLVATDSYKMCILSLSDDVTPIMGHVVHRSDLLKWYKLASHKDVLRDTDLFGMHRADDQAMFKSDNADKSEYPKWQPILDRGKEAPETISAISFNAEYVATMQKLSGTEGGLRWEFTGRLDPMICNMNDDIYVVMPLKH